MATIPEELLEKTFVIEYNPNCPSPWLVRLNGRSAIIDKKPYHRTNDRLGFGKTVEEAYKDAIARTFE